MTEIPNDRPKLLKARQLHSRIFACAVVVLLLVSQPWMAPDNALRALMLWLGYVLVIAGAMGRGYCSAYIGGRKNDVVMRDGPFSIVRNPLYVFSFLAIVGIGLETGTFTFLALLTGSFIVYYPSVVEKEEDFLRHKFGEAYEAYLREVPRWKPNFKLWHDPEEIPVRPKFIRKTLLDASIFFLPLPGFHLLAAMQAWHWLPLWLTLP